MKKKLLPFIALTAAVLLGNGCATYSKQAWTPDSLNYTISRDRVTGELVDYVGLTWDLKP